MFCHECGTQIDDGAAFCHNCGTKVIYETADSHVKYKPSRAESGRNNRSTAKKVLTVVAALFVLGALVFVLWKFWYLLLGVAVIGGLILALVTGSKEEKHEARMVIVKMVAGLALVCVVGVVLARNPDVVSDIFNPDFVYNIFVPGANVRYAYLSQYSDKVTIEDAFNNFFANGKWSTYKAEGYSYVVFTGTCEYNGEPADARLTFKITGERFLVDSLDINGIEQNDWMLALMLAKVYENY